MPQGTIKKLVTDKGFGFIAGDRGDLFFHHSALQNTTIEALQIDFVGRQVSVSHQVKALAKRSGSCGDIEDAVGGLQSLLD